MPLPDKHADEATVEIDENLFKRHLMCVQNAKFWQDQAAETKAEILALMGEIPAALVGGAKVITHRTARNYATARLREDYPELTQHFMQTRLEEVFDIDMFSRLHPEIAEKYRVRSFKITEA